MIQQYMGIDHLDVQWASIRHNVPYARLPQHLQLPEHSLLGLPTHPMLSCIMAGIKQSCKAERRHTRQRCMPEVDRLLAQTNVRIHQHKQQWRLQLPSQLKVQLPGIPEHVPAEKSRLPRHAGLKVPDNQVQDRACAALAMRLGSNMAGIR